MINSKAEFVTALKTLIGDDTSDNTLEILEYATGFDDNNENTITELNTRITELESEKNELDKKWREKYKNTFFNPETLDKSLNTGKDSDDIPDNYPVTFDDLFKAI